MTKIDLPKGYWQVPLTDRSKEISAFVTPDGLYQCKVMPFGGLYNYIVISGLDGCEAYIDDVIIYPDTWDDHLRKIRILNISSIDSQKSEFCHATVIILGHFVGQGQVKPIEAKVKAVSEFPVPSYKRELMRFLGMAVYYRKFCNNFSVIAEALHKST